MPSAELAEYFTAERQGGFLLVALALAGFGFAAFLWVTRSAFLAMHSLISVLWFTRNGCNGSSREPEPA